MAADAQRLLQPLVQGDGLGDATKHSGAEDVSTAYLVEAVRRRSSRTRACYSLPVSLLMYVLFCGSFVWHSDSTTAYEFETAVLNTFVYSGFDGAAFADSVFDRATWATWLRQSFLPSLIVGDGGDPTDGTRLLNGNAQPLGGVRLLQLRTSLRPCVDPSTLVLYPGACYEKSLVPATTNGGQANAVTVGDVGNATVGAEYGVPPSAYTLSTLPGDTLLSYQLLLSTLGPVDAQELVIDGLEASGWADASTSLLRVQAALLNAQADVDKYALLSFDLVLTRGGIPRLKASVSSFPTFMYGRGYTTPTASTIMFIDVLLCFYAVYLLLGTLRRSWRACAARRGVSGKLHAVFADAWRLIDYGACLSLLSTIITWSMFGAAVTSMRLGVASDPSASAAVYSDGTSRPGFLVTLLSCGDLFASAKLSASWALIFLAVRQFKYLQYQSRLAVFSQSLSMSIADGAAFTILFVIILSVYGVWGHAMFGNQAPDWQDGRVTLTSLFRFMMYDYDLPAMESGGYVDMARLFFASYMLLVTNMTLWMFLAIFLDSYTVVRAASHTGTGMLEDAADAGLAIGEKLLTCPPWRRGGCCSRTNNGVASCDAVLDSLGSGPLSSSPRLTLGQFMGVARHAAQAGVGHALTSEQVKGVWEEARTIELVESGPNAISLPALTGLSSEEEGGENGRGKSEGGTGGTTTPAGAPHRSSSGGGFSLRAVRKESSGSRLVTPVRVGYGSTPAL